MNGKRRFIVSDSSTLFDITLHRNVTVLRGNGGSGKTRLHKFISEAGKKGSGVHLTDTTSNVLAASDDFLERDLRRYRGTDTIFVFDEDFPYFSSNEFREAITTTGCYFLIISRGSFSGFGVSTKEIYELEHKKNADLNKEVYILKPCYPDIVIGSVENKVHVITEDSGAGFQLFERILPGEDETGRKYVVSAHGKSNVADFIMQNPNSLIFVDGAAFGFDLQDALAAAETYNCTIIALESFEYCILRSGIVTLPSGTDLDAPCVNYNKCLTWEQYYTDLLEELTQGTPLQYSKFSLNRRYSAPANASRIMAVYNQAAEPISYAASKTAYF